MEQTLRERIKHGDLKPGDRLPAEPDLCQLFAVSRTVVRQALGELTSEGLLIRRKGKGTFVAEPKITEGLIQKLTGFYQDMSSRGHKVVTQVLKQVVLPASHDVAARLALEPGAPVLQLDRLRFVDGVPLVFVTTYLPYDRCPQLLREDLTHQSLYALLEDKYGLVIARGRRTIEAVAASDTEARLLGVESGAPLLHLDSISYLEDGTPIEFYHALHRGDRSRFEVELIRVREHGERRDATTAVPHLPPSNLVVEPVAI